MTVLETIQRSTEFLDRKGVDSPRLQSESLLAHVLGLPRMQLYLNFQRELTAAELDACRDLVRRRGQRMPLQHLVGSVSFCGLEIRVGRQALIPRPETEQLVDHATALLRASTAPSPRVLDLGTGTGCIAIALAVRCPAARILATDLSLDALALAQSNALAHQVTQRVGFLQADGLRGLPDKAVFHLIASNPPYIPTAEIEQLQPEVRDHDPRAALDGGADGLDFYRAIAVQAAAHLVPEGALLVEHGDGQSPAITGLLLRENWIVDPPLPDYSGRERFLVARPTKPGIRP
ncbi:MAG: peptide chain release factor N(5)-glutamine methyltransferase [Verrucomicrobia bacterium]|jgi:release factor glutamine methyltransferase|nr:peptide chain release factor N(5)-glutamine methyltransferase [Verrucomicrobiota bacterium]